MRDKTASTQMLNMQMVQCGLSTANALPITSPGRPFSISACIRVHLLTSAFRIFLLHRCRQTMTGVLAKSSRGDRRGEALPRFPPPRATGTLSRTDARKQAWPRTSCRISPSC